MISIEHGDNYIWNMELSPYDGPKLSDMFWDSHIIIEENQGGELYPQTFISRVQEQEWIIVHNIYCRREDVTEEARSILNRIHEIDPMYDDICTDDMGGITGIKLHINKDMEIGQVYQSVSIAGDFILDLIDSIRLNKISRISRSYIYRKMPIYFRAMKQVKLELENYVSDNEANKDKICDICGRVKNIDSICEKIKRKGIKQFDVFEKFDDIAGTRCTCEYLDDVYDMLEYIKNNPLFNVIKIEDKIEKPSEEGYRGIHIIVYTSVYYNGNLEEAKVEIQLRTAFQNAWSMKTHSLTYKQDMSKLGEISDTMRRLSDLLYDADKTSSEMLHQKELMQNSEKQD